VNYLSVEISRNLLVNVRCLKISFGINKDQKLPSLPKTVLEKTTIMSIINGLEESDTSIVKRRHQNGILSQNNNLQEELTIEESIFASDNETLKVIEAYEKALENRKMKKHQKLLTEWINIMLGILKRNTSKFCSN
jgi:ATP-binding cassette subfamily F protein uup